jgi:RNA polymerase sigma factor (sigma-70 family)
MNLSELNDHQIWTSFKKGEEWAVSFIYSEYAEKLYQYGLKFTSEISTIEDALQDLFAELIKKRKRLGYTDNILLYLLKSFKRKLLRKLQSEKRFFRDSEMESYYFEVCWSVEHELILEELSQQKARLLLKALKELTPRQKEAIYLRFTKEMDYNAIAEMMDISIEGARNLISKAISTIKRKYIHEKNHDSLVLFLLSIK